METDAGGGELGRAGVVVGVILAAILQYSSKLSGVLFDKRSVQERGRRLTVFYSFPNPILFCPS